MTTDRSHPQSGQPPTSRPPADSLGRNSINRHSNPQEQWIQLEDGQSMSALISGELGWLMYLPTPESAGSSSRNPAYAGPPAAVLEHDLASGKRAYPLAWALPAEQVLRALDWFKQHREPPPFIAWHDDSGA